MKEIPGILPFLEKSESNLIWESHQKQGINNAGLRTKSPLMLEIIWSQVTGFKGGVLELSANFWNEWLDSNLEVKISGVKRLISYCK